MLPWFVVRSRDPGLVVVFVPGCVADVVAFVFNAPVLAYMGVQVGWTGVFDGAAGDDEGELFVRMEQH